MSAGDDTHKTPPVDRTDDAATAFIDCLQEQRTDEDRASLEQRLADDPEFAESFRSIDDTWRSLGDHATSPEFMALREQALARARRANARRWGRPITERVQGWRRIAAAAVVIVGLVALQLSPLGYRPGQYRTGIGEQLTVDLADRSQIALDAATRLRVRFSDDARIIYLDEGQAQFTVARDPLRPFRVVAGDQTIVALGTVFTVEVLDRQTRVAMLEGKVAVVPTELADRSLAPALTKTLQAQRSGKPAGIVELVAGEALRASGDGPATVIAKADIEAATAWRQGRIIFNKTPLAEAVRRLNRYSRSQLSIEDAALDDMNISGVFTAGDSAAFAEAVAISLPIVADYSDADTIRMRAR